MIRMGSGLRKVPMDTSCGAEDIEPKIRMRGRVEDGFTLRVGSFPEEYTRLFTECDRTICCSNTGNAMS
jgi:hypothetical protein